MFDVIGIPYYFLGFFHWGRSLEHSVTKPLVFVARLVDFSDTWLAAEEKMTGDVDRMTDADESIHCILNRVLYPGVVIDHFSNSIFHTVVYGHVDSYGELEVETVSTVAEWYRHRIVDCLVTSSNSVPLKTGQVGQRCTSNLSRVETSSHWCGVVVRRGGASLGVLHVT
ncbi:uncharacterized protein TNCV_395621 [Trichonephila clavipes]|nr:uncharacterized protein TNCV_395621 [Trichonephila clavipes]